MRDSVLRFYTNGLTFERILVFIFVQGKRIMEEIHWGFGCFFIQFHLACEAIRLIRQIRQGSQTPKVALILNIMST